MLKKIAAIAASCIAVGMLSLVSILPANAHTVRGDPNEDCNSYTLGHVLYTKCANAWFGGPNVKDYNQGVTNDAFTITSTTLCNNGKTSTNCPITGVPIGLNIVSFQFSGGGTYNDDFIGDLNNSQSNAQAGLVGSGGWGTYFVEYPSSNCTSGSAIFVNDHWSAGGNWNSSVGLAWPQDGNNGGQAYLNEVNQLCIDQQSF